MGTHCLIIFRTREGEGAGGKYKVYALVYHHMDGYPEGAGLKLVNFIQSKEMVNGISDLYNQFNGFGCMVAQYISKFKGNKAGYTYVYPISDNLEDIDVEFKYYVTWNEKNKLFTISINDSEEVTLNNYEKTFLNDDSLSE